MKTISVGQITNVLDDYLQSFTGDNFKNVLFLIDPKYRFTSNSSIVERWIKDKGLKFGIFRYDFLRNDYNEAILENDKIVRVFNDRILDGYSDIDFLIMHQIDKDDYSLAGSILNERTAESISGHSYDLPNIKLVIAFSFTSKAVKNLPLFDTFIVVPKENEFLDETISFLDRLYEFKKKDFDNDAEKIAFLEENIRFKKELCIHILSNWTFKFIEDNVNPTSLRGYFLGLGKDTNLIEYSKKYIEKEKWKINISDFLSLIKEFENK